MASFRTNLRVTALLTIVAVGAGLSLRAAADPKEPPPELTEFTSEQINEKLRPALDGREWDKALGIIETILAKVSADSYDAALIYGLKAQTCLQKSNLAAALESLERSVAISDRHHFFSERATLESVYNISQLYYQEGATSKDPKRQQQLFTKTLANLERWLKGTDAKTYTQDNLQFISSVYFTLGQGEEVGGVQKTSLPMMEKALYWINLGLRSAIHPRDVFYQLKIAALFQLDRLTEGFEFLEARLKEKPDSRSYWQQLAATYIQLADIADKKKDTQGYFSYNVRAILTMQRAQKLGFMVTPKDNYQLVGMFFNINQFDRACELLADGLTNGKIESTEQNWQLLAYSYQQEHKDLKAIAALEQATKVFPKTGQLEYQIAQTYFGINDENKAFDHIKLCVANGGTDKPHVAWLFYAYLALDLKKYDEGLKAAQEAAKYPEAAVEAKRMQEALKASMQDEANRHGTL